MFKKYTADMFPDETIGRKTKKETEFTQPTEEGYYWVFTDLSKPSLCKIEKTIQGNLYVIRDGVDQPLIRYKDFKFVPIPMPC